jgi:hypothetical protein
VASNIINYLRGFDPKLKFRVSDSSVRTDHRNRIMRSRNFSREFRIPTWLLDAITIFPSVT